MADEADNRLNFTQRELLIRIDERTKNLVGRFEDFEKSQIRFVSRDEFDPIKKVVYGMVSLVLVAVVTALIGMVVTQ